MAERIMQTLSAIAPFVICLVMILIQLCLWQKYKWQKALHLAGAGIYFMSSLTLAIGIYQKGSIQLDMGNWPYPAAIMFRVDCFSALLLVVTAFIYCAICFYQMMDISKRTSVGYYFACWLLLLGITGVLCTADLFNLYVWFEDMLIATFILLISQYRRYGISAMVKYIILNLLATMFLLFSIGLIYGYTGQLNMLAVHDYLILHPSNIVSILLVFFVLSLGAKAALFPIFFWLPSAYSQVNESSSALFAGTLTKVSLYVLFRLFLQVFPVMPHMIEQCLAIVAGLTMLLGVLMAAVQFRFRSVLSCHIISQVGYIFMGLLIHTPLSIAGAIFFMLHNMLTKTNLFLIAGISNKIHRSEDLRKVGGLYKLYPFLSLLFFINAFSLAGLPPLSGFWGKFFLIKAGLMSQHLILAIVAIVTSFFTLYSMNKLWQFAFIKNAEKTLSHLHKQTIEQRYFAYSAMILLTIGVLFLSFDPNFFYQISQKAADQLLLGA